jgi:hypothetical protein
MRLPFLIVTLVAATVVQAATLPSKAGVTLYAQQLLADNYTKDAPGAAVIVARR